MRTGLLFTVKRERAFGCHLLPSPAACCANEVDNVILIELDQLRRRIRRRRGRIGIIAELTRLREAMRDGGARILLVTARSES